jgi:hypothetical protein
MYAYAAGLNNNYICKEPVFVNLLGSPGIDILGI